MSMIRRYWRLGTVAVTCLAIGAGASLVSSAGATTGQGMTAAAKHARSGTAAARRLLARSVHGDLVVATKTGFATVTFDRGVVQSVSGRSLTMTEGSKRPSVRTVTLTIPASARIRDDRLKATLADLKAGQRVMVVQAPRRTLVVARSLRAP